MIKKIIAKLRQRKLAKSSTALTGVVRPNTADFDRVAAELNKIAAKNGWALSDPIEIGNCACGGNGACGGKKPAAKKPAAKKPAAKRTDAPVKKSATEKKKK